MSRVRGIGRAFLAIATTMVGLSAFTTPTAYAADDISCTGKQHREFDTPGYNVDVYLQLCVWRTGSTYDAETYIDWADGGGARKFDLFWVETRLEKNDAAITYNGCDFTRAINDNETGGRTCGTASHTGSGTGWTADATVGYNIDLDGEGEFTWNLTGTPKI
ncbi:hypothetical protein ACFY0F_17715 [Streptomyces sp. NPDC001544]|uniref:hypothetical protein n=1 Tax=Streptomyces sp. NPDC001544 TaxID=3364584 RepID=UPI0036B8B52B